jgi:hypothetical protein
MLLVGMIAVSSCTESPTDGFEAFYQAVLDGDGDAARARMTARAYGPFAVATQAAHLTPSQALQATTMKTTVRQIVEVKRAGDSALIDVIDALGQAQRVHMLRVDNRWLVDAPADAAPVAAADGVP